MNEIRTQIIVRFELNPYQTNQLIFEVCNIYVPKYIDMSLNKVCEDIKIYFSCVKSFTLKLNLKI